ncbi:hypothetical protein Asera_02120 [Actinocatenispora sera]|uniref:HTH gntR-type domain-containing protein n=1 Tax=Actinocatenispora sera TaxID=390989 RepID=A0A810KT37_9ACTN|nr:hypothetical protein Asera_02120 [Actinocatenispora sera]
MPGNFYRAGVAVDPESPELIYAQVARILRDRVQDGTYTNRLPGELDLANELGVSRPSLRRGVAILVDEGVLVVVRGKGMYVNR